MRRRRRYIDKKQTMLKNISGLLASAVRTTPISVLAGALLIIWQAQRVPAGFIGAISSTAFFILLLGMALTFWFNRSRVFFILFILCLSLLGFIVLPGDSADHRLALNGMYVLTSLLLPLNLLFFSSLSERGILSAWGKRHFTIVFFQVIFVTGLVSSGDQDITVLLTGKIFTHPPVLQTPIPDISVLISIFVAVVLCMRLYKSKATFKTAAAGVFAAVLLALHFQATSYALPLFYAAAGLILILSVIQESYAMAYLDELTRLFSRRALNEELLRLSGNYAIAMLDVDHFKKFNDTYGHDAGDDVLRLVAGHINNVTGGGKPFRYGGEEFTILFPGKKVDDIMPHLEELRERIAKHKFILRQNEHQRNPRTKLSVTISIGAAETSENCPTTDEVLKAADTALYRAKENGRNCICK